MDSKPLASDDEKNCFEVVNNAIADHAGIVDIHVDTAREQVAFEYDPALVHDEAIATLARKVEPTLRQRFDTCTLRLAPQAGRACEACAMKIERRMNNGLSPTPASTRPHTRCCWSSPPGCCTA